MRILQIADVDPSPDLGAAGTEYESARALKQLGLDVTTVWTDELSHRIRHYNLRYVLELPQSIRTAVLGYLSKAHYDIVQVSQPHGYLAAAALADRHPRTRFVHRSHGFEPHVKEALGRWSDLYKPRRALHRRLATVAMGIALERNNRNVARYADGHLVSATECAEFIATRYSVPAARVAAVPQATPQAFQHGSAVVDAERLNRLLYVGQYAFVKAPMVLAKIVSKILAANRAKTMTWVCAARHHEEARSSVDADVRNRLKFVDWMPQEKLLDVYDSHGVFLFPSFFEGFGKAFLEAMSRGLIVVAARNGGMKDVIVNGRNGFTVETGDVDAFVSAACGAAADLGAAQIISKSAIESARLLTWERYAAECSAFYERLLNLPKFAT